MHVVFFSGGAASWAAARRIADQHGTDEMVLLFTDTKTEDEDLVDVADVLGAAPAGDPNAPPAADPAAPPPAE